MNERIKLLAEQAFQPINDISTEGVADRYTFEQAWFQMYNQKFAQLIVRECVQFAYKEADHLEDEFERGRADDLRRWANVMKQHFGVD